MTPNTARKELLDTVHDLMSGYLGDECPEDETWEDFDPEIDRLRSEIDDLLGAENEILASASTEPTRFAVDIDFFCGFDRFATETYTVDAIDWIGAKIRAFNLADTSPYSNDRIPDLSRRARDRTAYPKG